MSIIRNLATLRRTDLGIAGGKGANLGELIAADLPVPPGFCVITPAYRGFVAVNGLQSVIRRILDETHLDEPESLESASIAIRALFEAAGMPRDTEAEIRDAYAAMTPDQPVAVRSSATAEDLPDLSFAGQQDTYLNIRGIDALLDAARRCWASLWTARAIGYRARNDISQDGVALAVVVQQMVSSEASGVLFTANPLTGHRGEMVIDATFGLGEALVSGQVEPDHYVVESAGSKRILTRTIGAKALSIEPLAGGGVRSTQSSDHRDPAVSDAVIAELARLGGLAATHFGSPQDLEWAWAGGKAWVVQSRPITSLFPLPPGVREDPLEVLLSFGVWQGMLDPYTPVGRAIFTGLTVGVGRMFRQALTPESQRVFLVAGERLWVNLTRMLRNPIGRRIISVALPSIDPVSGEILDIIKDDPRLATGTFGTRSRLALLRGLFPILRRVLANLAMPARGRRRLECIIQDQLDFTRKGIREARSLTALVEFIEAFFQDRPDIMLPALLGGVVSGQVPLQALLRITNSLPDGPALVMELTRGLPHNVTTEMDLALWRAARALREDPEALACFRSRSVEELVAMHDRGELPEAARKAIHAFMELYGMRGIAEIDLGRPRWHENPSSLFSSIQAYLGIAEKDSPQTIFEQGAVRAGKAADALVAAIRATRGGWLKSRVVRAMIRRVRELGGLRESPKFAIIRLTGMMRGALMAHGVRLVEAGRLARADDVFFLHLPELKVLEREPDRDWPALVEERRATIQREFRRRRVPRILLSDGRAFHESPRVIEGTSADTLVGSPVSAGSVEGRVRVVLDPHHDALEPGEILVCPATDPAWTPLFLAAAGLVMEVGGMMTHGSVVAREYGIPAVVGVTEVTTRLRTGQRVRVDGSTGRVTLLGERNPEDSADLGTSPHTGL